VDTVVVYEVDRLNRSLTDFVKLVELIDAQSVPFVSVTQGFNTTHSMGRLIDVACVSPVGVGIRSAVLIRHVVSGAAFADMPYEAIRNCGRQR
jgi:hypothetical protein